MLKLLSKKKTSQCKMKKSIQTIQ